MAISGIFENSIEFFLPNGIESATFAQAVNICDEFNSSLAFVNNEAENDFLINFANEIFEDPIIAAYLGYSDPDELGESLTSRYTAVSDEANLTFFETPLELPWFDFSPLNEDEDGACIVMLIGTVTFTFVDAEGNQRDEIRNATGEWFDTGCDGSFRFICRREAIIVEEVPDPDENDVEEEGEDDDIVKIFLPLLLVIGLGIIISGLLLVRSNNAQRKLLVRIQENTMLQSRYTEKIDSNVLTKSDIPQLKSANWFSV